jgi:hypothetical protein
MTDTVRVTNLADSGSHERVAFELFKYLSHLHPEGGDAAAQAAKMLEFYKQCRNATYGGSIDATKLS